MRAFVDLHCHYDGRASIRLSAPADVVRAAHARGLTHLAITDHDRIDGALEARALAPAGPDGHRRRGGQDPRRRPDLRLPRAGHPARPVRASRRSRRPASRAAWSGSRTRSIGTRGSLLRERVDGARRARPSTGSRRTTRGSSASGNEQAAGVRARARPARRRRLRRPLDPGGRRRLHGARRRSVDAGRPARGARSTSSSSRAVPASTSGSGRPSPRCIQRARGNGRVEPAPSEATPSGPGGAA